MAIIFTFKMSIHIGAIIKEELYKQGISVSAFAKKINRSRNVVYNIFERESVDTSLLNKIGLILRTDFFSIYSEQKVYKKENVLPLVTKEDKSLNNTIAHQLKLSEQQNEVLKNEVAYLKKIIVLMEGKKKK